MYQDTYNKEPACGGRTAAILSILDSLLKPYLISSEASEIKADGSIQTENGDCYIIMQVKDGIGTGGSDPTIQGAVIYAKHWAQDHLRRLRPQCCCPTFILAIAGSWVYVFGGVMLRHPVIQPLTPLLSLVNNSLGHLPIISLRFLLPLRSHYCSYVDPTEALSSKCLVIVLMAQRTFLMLAILFTMASVSISSTSLRYPTRRFFKSRRCQEIMPTE
ncbi:hypothetical protein B0J17DRAFT_111141 [Rhizoctonia solani]|nr:hypothetical protein B0J17DRAFT_111141 [Rhizoctonia solani]